MEEQRGARSDAERSDAERSDAERSDAARSCLFQNSQLWCRMSVKWVKLAGTTSSTPSPVIDSGAGQECNRAEGKSMNHTHMTTLAKPQISIVKCF